MHNFALPNDMLWCGPRANRLGIHLGIPDTRANTLLRERTLCPIGFIESCVSG